MKTRNRHSANKATESDFKLVWNEYSKVKLQSGQYIRNLLNTNRTILHNNNINSLLLF